MTTPMKNAESNTVAVDQTQDMVDTLSMAFSTKQKVQRFYNRLLSCLIAQERKTLNLHTEVICCEPQTLPVDNPVPVCIVRRGCGTHVVVSIVSACVATRFHAEDDNELVNVRFDSVTKDLPTKTWNSIYTKTVQSGLVSWVTRACQWVIGLDAGFTGTHNKSYYMPNYGMERVLLGDLVQAIRASHDQVMFGHYQGQAEFHDFALEYLQLQRNPEDPMHEDAGDNLARLKQFMTKDDFTTRRDALLAEFKKVLK